MFVSAEEGTTDWAGFTLVLPAVSVGNVGQLATDLLISTLCPSLAGYFNTDNVLPVVGCDPYSEKPSAHLATAVQVYVSVNHKLVIIQQRTPCIKGKAEAYVMELIEWIKECSFKHIVLLTSMFAHERLDSQITGPQTRYLITPAGKTSCGMPETSGWIELEKRTGDYGTDDSSAVPFIPGGGIAKRFYTECVDKSLPLTVLLVFTAEGVNISDALTLAVHSNDYLKLLPGAVNQSSFKIPASWKLTFGNLTDRSLF